MGKKMRLPNGYGSVYKLSGNRRKPYAVAITQGLDIYGKQIRKIIGYASSRADGLNLLSEYHKNPFSDIELLSLTYEDAFWKWFDSIKKEDKMAKANQAVYESVFKNHCKLLYSIKVVDLKTLNVQNCIDNCSKGFNTKKYIKLISSQLFKFCSISLDMNLSINFSEGLKLGKQIQSKKHYPFSHEEIKILWDNLEIEFVDSILISIYTGLRPSELLKIEIVKVFPDQRYMIGGIKTNAGIDRTIPIHYSIMPLIERLINTNKKYLIEKNGKPVNYRYYRDVYDNIMKTLKMKHTPHDGRHTLATELDNLDANEVCIKLILGHKIDDITKGVYTHKNLEQLIATIDLINYLEVC